MINEVVVRILAERIARKGENPLRKRAFILDDVTNPEYRKAVEDYIIEHSANATGILEETKEVEVVEENKESKEAEIPEEKKKVESVEEKPEDNKEESSVITQ